LVQRNPCRPYEPPRAVFCPRHKTLIHYFLLGVE
jgi:hypothetical protein